MLSYGNRRFRDPTVDHKREGLALHKWQTVVRLCEQIRTDASLFCTVLSKKHCGTNWGALPIPPVKALEIPNRKKNAVSQNDQPKVQSGNQENCIFSNGKELFWGKVWKFTQMSLLTFLSVNLLLNDLWKETFQSDRHRIRDVFVP